MSHFEAEGRDALGENRVVFRVSDRYAARIAQRNKQRQVRRRIATIAVASVCVASLLAIPIARAVVGNDPATRLDAVGRLPTLSTEPNADGASGAPASVAPKPPVNGATRSGAAPSSSSTRGTEPEPSVVVGGPAPNGTSAQTARPAPRAAPAARAGSAGRTAPASLTGPAVTTTPPAQLSDAEPASTEAAPAPGGPGAAAGISGSLGDAEGAECIVGPDTLAVGEEGVFSKAGGSTPPYSWTPEAPGAYMVVLEAQAEGTTCLKAVTVTPADETTPTGSNAPAQAAEPDLTSGDRWAVIRIPDSFPMPLSGT